MKRAGVRQSKLMRKYSTLAGPLHNVQSDSKKPYTVKFTDIISYDKMIYRHWTRLVAYGSILIVLAFAFILFQPSNWIALSQPESALRPANWLMLVCLGILQIFLIIGTYAATRATLKAKDPVPVRYPARLRVAFATTRAPGEPVEMVHDTLVAALNVRRHKMTVDVWLLDETRDDTLIEMCEKLGVKYFSRNGVARWNTLKRKDSLVRKLTMASGWGNYIYRQKAGVEDDSALYDPYFAAKSKHGNFNSWINHLESEKLEYDILAGVDTDHVPEPNYLERITGYFRDPNVAYVVGPQVYGNYTSGLKGLVARWSESQASFFQSTIQRAGNSAACPMFVGTNYAIRFNVLKQIGGFQPCITEDMATGLAIHSKKNPATGKRWKSIYTPDVLAVGEGPDLWGPYFTQQWRWAAGTFDTWRRTVWRVFFRLSPKAMLHYALVLTFYPITALTWLFGVISSMTYLLTGATAILAPWNEFVTLYLMSLVMQLSLYFWNRRYNVSPFDASGTYGVPGMILTSLTAPIYLSAFAGIIFGKKPNFVVTKKGGHNATDRLKTFSIHLSWAALLTGGLIFGLLNGHTNAAMMIWAFMQVVLCLTPVSLSLALRLKNTKSWSLTKRINVQSGGIEHA